MQDQQLRLSAAAFKLNPQAPEFIPKTFPQKSKPISSSISQNLPSKDDKFRSKHVDIKKPRVDSEICKRDVDKCKKNNVDMTHSSYSPQKIDIHKKNHVDMLQTIVKQVEYQFSDLNLIASDFLTKIIIKDSEGYVPISIISSWKKMKNLGANNHMMIKALRTSSKLVVSDDGKKVRRKVVFTEKLKEEIMLRTVIVENLPEDFSHKNIEKIFSVVGSIKNIKICHPQESDTPKFSKADMLISKKLHAFVEFETSIQADNAVEKLNDERNWRKGLRVRSLVRRTPRSVIRSKVQDYDHFDLNSEESQSPLSQSLESPKAAESHIEDNATNNQNGAKKRWGRGHGISTNLVKNNDNQCASSHTQQGAYHISNTSSTNTIKQAFLVPKMPDGTRGFTMGRGKPLKPVVTSLNLVPIRT